MMAGSSLDMGSLKSNSHKSREKNESGKDREKLAPVVKKDGVVSTKKPLGQRFAETFLNEDVDDVKSYILLDVIIPGIKDTILDVLEMMFFGGTSSRSKRRHGSKDKDKVSYSSYYKSESSGRRSDRRRRDRDDEPRRRDDKIDYQSIIVRNRPEAEEIVDQMHRRIKEYGAASVADLLDLIDVSGTYTDNNWGWTSADDIGLKRVSSGYLIDVEEAEYLD